MYAIINNDQFIDKIDQVSFLKLKETHNISPDQTIIQLTNGLRVVPIIDQLDEDIPLNKKIIEPTYVVSDDKNSVIHKYLLEDISIGQCKTEYMNLLASDRYSKEILGINSSLGFSVDTSRPSQAMIIGMYNVVNRDNSKIIKFKDAGGLFHSLDYNDIDVLSTEVSDYVEDCFNRESDICDLILAAESYEEIDNIYNTEKDLNWPSQDFST